MTTVLDALTDKEKQALRLILRSHDARSAARELALSVHTVNERLREARRKLGVTSSREAARRLLAEETPESAPEILADKPLGDAPEGAPAAEITASATRRWARSGLALPALGVLAMSLILAALFLPASRLSVLAPVPDGRVLVHPRHHRQRIRPCSADGLPDGQVPLGLCQRDAADRDALADVGRWRVEGGGDRIQL